MGDRLWIRISEDIDLLGKRLQGAHRAFLVVDVMSIGVLLNKAERGAWFLQILGDLKAASTLKREH